MAGPHFHQNPYVDKISNSNNSKLIFAAELLNNYTCELTNNMLICYLGHSTIRFIQSAFIHIRFSSFSGASDHFL